MDLSLLRFKDQLQLRQSAAGVAIYDSIRKKWLVLQPEEMVRQLAVLYLIEEKRYNKNRIKIEKSLRVNTLYKRCDILVYDQDMRPFLLVECKAPQVKISEATFRQLAAYNLPLRVPYLLAVNGIAAYCCRMDYETESWALQDSIPDYPS
ncbi:MAG: type I restriction enzyme HsdR N-terminal domain-containing protein [Saprospiraceae bacterium]|nr:type I restriction enzyme HsdR N-terminal domain-containing protein [Saprospiraceae bacterium]MDZ4704192.1 type I restriction enzyme HsdR N-terminal domain-containing protein [Saprospiraceae bacterium]